MSEEDSELAKAAVGHTLAKSELERMQEYLQRGRPFERTSLSDLHAMFIRTFKESVADLRNADARARSNDVRAEYTLRGMEPPFEDVKEDMQLLIQAAEEMVEGLTPERAEEIDKEIIEEYDAARRSQN